MDDPRLIHYNWPPGRKPLERIFLEEDGTFNGQEVEKRVQIESAGAAVLRWRPGMAENEREILCPSRVEELSPEILGEREPN